MRGMCPVTARCCSLAGGQGDLFRHVRCGREQHAYRRRQRGRPGAPRGPPARPQAPQGPQLPRASGGSVYGRGRAVRRAYSKPRGCAAARCGGRSPSTTSTRRPGGEGSGLRPLDGVEEGRARGGFGVLSCVHSTKVIRVHARGSCWNTQLCRRALNPAAARAVGALRAGRARVAWAYLCRRLAQTRARRTSRADAGATPPPGPRRRPRPAGACLKSRAPGAPGGRSGSPPSLGGRGGGRLMGRSAPGRAATSCPGGRGLKGGGDFLGGGAVWGGCVLGEQLRGGHCRQVSCGMGGCGEEPLAPSLVKPDNTAKGAPI